MTDIFNKIQDHLPPYLSPAQKELLYRELKSFPQKFSYYTSNFADQLLQGDGWNGLTVLDFDTAQKKQVKAIILSNTCDIDPKNKRSVPPKIIFAPIVRLTKYHGLLSRDGLSDKEITDKINAIKRQEVTSIFYLPRGGKMDDEYIVSLDDLHSQPYNSFQQSEKLFTLSQQGFYLFLLKLSIHFCRFNDGLIRFE
jgi:hypothetical protein